MIKIKTTDFLLAKANFISGVASVIDIFAQAPKYRQSKKSRNFDADAISHDWHMIGQDFRNVLNHKTPW